VVTLAATIATGGAALLPMLAGYSIMTGGMLAFDRLGWPEPQA
jgi:hypothetical protein